MFDNPRRGRQARNLTTNAPKILDLKSTTIFQKLTLGAPERLAVFPGFAITLSARIVHSGPPIILNI